MCHKFCLSSIIICFVQEEEKDDDGNDGHNGETTQKQNKTKRKKEKKKERKKKKGDWGKKQKSGRNRDYIYVPETIKPACTYFVHAHVMYPFVYGSPTTLPDTIN